MPLSQANYEPAMSLGARTGHFSPGGTVTQLTNRSTGVTVNYLSGAITTNATSLAAAAAATFVVTNSSVLAGDVVSVSLASGSVSGNTDVYVSAVAAGSFSITVANQTAATPETGALVINFLVMNASSTN
jgi:hypothetical protein